jgi:N utilization substance protein A
LQPAKVSRVTVVDSAGKHLEVVVDDSQLSLAIGKKGQNVRLAAKLLGWKIDIKSEEEKRQEVEQQMAGFGTQTTTPLEKVEGLGEGLVEKLNAAGVSTVEALADMTPEQLEAIEGIGPKTVEKISLAVNNYFASLDAAEAGVAPEEAAAEGAVPEEFASEVPVEAAAEGTIEADAITEGAAPEADDAEGSPAVDLAEQADAAETELPAEELALEGHHEAEPEEGSENDISGNKA